MTQLLGQKYWGGVCGFVSVIHGLLLSKGGNALDGLTPAELEYNLGSSLLEFLKKIRTNSKIAGEIVAFTRAFGGRHTNKTMEQLITEGELQLAKLVKRGPAPSQSIEESDWGVAMTKDALVEYIKFLGLGCTPLIGITQWSQSELRSKCRDCVVGVGDIAETDNGFGGLRHWVYVSADGVLYNWGAETPLKESPDRPYARDNHNIVVHVLKLTR
jgi:hypothetical protein